jgi:ubiquinone/menaquinone biosynthesis C-methylase UbiE
VTYKGKDHTAGVWDDAAEGWVDFVRTGKDYWRDGVNNPSTFRLIGSVKGKKVLDLACGEGYNTRILARKRAKVTGIDRSLKLIGLARMEERKEPLGIRYLWMSASRLRGLTNASFDLVTCFMALHDIENYESAVAEVARVLKKGGRFIFSITHPCFEDMVVNGVRINAAERYFDKVQHIIEWNMKRLTKPFKTVSFHRSLTDYSIVLAKSGFLISRLVEPRPTKEAMRKQRNLRKVLTKPQSIVFETVKP